MLKEYNDSMLVSHYSATEVKNYKKTYQLLGQKHQ